MCDIYAKQNPQRYELTTRSLRLDGFSTSIRLENCFWTVLERMAAAEDRSLTDLLSKLHDEMTAQSGGPTNFTSILRASCLIYVGDSDEGRKVIAAE